MNFSESVCKERFLDCTIYIFNDPSAESPDSWDDRSLFLVGYHRHFYVVQDGLKNPDDYKDKQWQDNYNIYPLYAYIHSGVRLSLNPFNDMWDSGQVGYVFASKEFTNPEKAMSSLIEAWNMYLSGNVYGYIIMNADNEEMSSCWGYYSEDPEKIIDIAKKEFVTSLLWD